MPSASMKDLDFGHLAAASPLAPGYRLALLERGEVPALIAAVAAWFPAIRVGGASGHLRDTFYAERVYFADGPERDVIVMVLKHGDELAGMFSVERDPETLSAYARLGVVAPSHRGANLVAAGLHFTEAFGRELGLGLAYGMATLRTPHVQRAFERVGWQLIGITPGYDRELVEPGIVRRVYEAVYARVLVPESALLKPHRQNLTPRTQTFFDQMFAPGTLVQAMELQDAAAG